LVMRRALGMPAVGQNLPLDFLQQNPPPRRHPSLACGNLGKRLPHDIESQRLAGQVSVRAEVIGQVLFDMTQLTVDGSEEAGSWQLAAGSECVLAARRRLPAACCKKMRRH